MLEIGTLVNNRYRVSDLIGRGGMSQVYIAIDRVSGATVAIKEALRKGVQNQQTVQLSLAAEGMLLKSLSNPHLPRIYDVIETPESIMIVMDYVEGESLDKTVEKNGTIDALQVIEWAIQICDVLGYLHSQTPPIIYRDMKPANVMLRPDGFIMMIDFGTARKWTDGKRTSDTILIGTEGFAAPEQYGGLGQSDARTDVFCLGATIFNLITGHNPYEKPYGVTKLGLWNNDLDGTPIDKVIQKCVANDPRDRFQNAEELKEALVGIRGNKANSGVLSKIRINSKKANDWKAPAMEVARQEQVKKGITKSFVQASSQIIKKGLTKSIEAEKEAANKAYKDEFAANLTQLTEYEESRKNESSKATWKIIMAAAFSGAAIVIVLGIILLLASEGSIVISGIIILVLLILLAGTGIFSLIKYIR